MSSETDRTVNEIRADLASNRQAVAAAMNDFVDSVSPANIAKRGIADAKALAVSEFEAIRDEFRDENGWRMDRILLIGGVILGAVVLVAGVAAISRGRGGNEGPYVMEEEA